MSLGTLVSLEEYLNTSYDPDVEYVDGELVERNVGDWLHAFPMSACCQHLLKQAVCSNLPSWPLKFFRKTTVLRT